jgi:hypothetical protein
MGRNGPDAHTLLMFLRAVHGGRCCRGNTFALVTEAMQREQTLPGWHWKRYADAIKLLLAAGFIVQVAPAMLTPLGRRPAQYRLAAADPMGRRAGGSVVTLPPKSGGWLSSTRTAQGRARS